MYIVYFHQRRKYRKNIYTTAGICLPLTSPHMIVSIGTSVYFCRYINSESAREF